MITVITSWGDFQIRITREHIEVSVVMKNGCMGADGDGTDKTIDQLANSFPLPATQAIEGSRLVVVHRPGGKKGRPCEESAEVMKMPFVGRAGEHFHPNRVADSDLAFKQ